MGIAPLANDRPIRYGKLSLSWGKHGIKMSVYIELIVISQDVIHYKWLTVRLVSISVYLIQYMTKMALDLGTIAFSLLILYRHLLFASLLQYNWSAIIYAKIPVKNSCTSVVYICIERNNTFVYCGQNGNCISIT